jgi:hypothetical protein
MVMKRVLLSIFVILLLVSCSSKTSSETRSAQLPDDIKNVIELFPVDIKDEMLFPTKLLSEKYTVDFGYTSEPVNDPNGNIVLSYFIYADENSETFKLKNGIEATYSETKNGLQRVVLWTDDNSTHEISLIENPQRNKPIYTKEEFLEVVSTFK